MCKLCANNSLVLHRLVTLHNMHNMNTTCAQHVRRYRIISENRTHISEIF